MFDYKFTNKPIQDLNFLSLQKKKQFLFTLIQGIFSEKM